MKKIKSFKSERGISLITLTISVIVLVILTGIVLKYTIGDNGLFSFIGSTKSTTDVATEKDQLSTAIKDAKALDYMQGGAGGLTKEGLQAALDDLVGVGKTKVTTSNGGNTDSDTGKGLDIVFVLDISGSMENNTLTVNGTRITRTKALVNALNTAMASVAKNKYNRVAIVTYSSANTSTAQKGTSNATIQRELQKIDTLDSYFTYSAENSRWGSSSDATISYKLTSAESSKSVTVVGGTYTETGILKGKEAIYGKQTGDYVDNVPVMILVTDGDPTYARGDGTTGTATYGNGSDQNSNVGYYTIKTAVSVKNAIWGDGDPYFYTVGIGLNSSNLFATTILNPTADNITAASNSNSNVAKTLGSTLKNNGINNFAYATQYYDQDDIDSLDLGKIFENILNSVIYAEGIQVWFQGEDGSDQGRIYVVNPDGTVSDDYVIGTKPTDDENTTGN